MSDCEMDCDEYGIVFITDAKGNRSIWACYCPKGNQQMHPIFYPGDKKKEHPVHMPRLKKPVSYTND